MQLMILLEQGDLAPALIPANRVVTMLRTCRRVRSVLEPLISNEALRQTRLGAVLAVRYEQRARDLEQVDLLRWNCRVELRILRAVHLEPLVGCIRAAALGSVQSGVLWNGPSVLRLEWCHLGPVGARLLAQNVLPHLRCLEQLHLSGNAILDSGMCEVAEAIAAQSSANHSGGGALRLEALYLGGNGVRKTGAGALGRLLGNADMTRLAHLDISDNELGPLILGAKSSELALGLCTLTNLETLVCDSAAPSGTRPLVARSFFAQCEEMPVARSSVPPYLHARTLQQRWLHPCM
jgi:hypothetical protein